MKLMRRGPKHLEVQRVQEGETISVNLACGARLVIEHSENSGDTIVVIPREFGAGHPVMAYDANGDELVDLTARVRAVNDG